MTVRVRLREIDHETFAPCETTLIDCAGARPGRVADVMVELMTRFRREGDEWRVGVKSLGPERLVIVVARRHVALAAQKQRQRLEQRQEAAGGMLH